MGDTYRERIYGSYVTGRDRALAPETLGGLAGRAWYLRRIVQRHFPNDKNAPILDLGCGHGALIQIARQAGYTNLRGVDWSPEQVAAARRLGIEGVSEGDLVQTLAASPSGSVGCIVAFDVIEHFTRDELIGLVDEVKRVLAPDGTWIIHAPNGDSPLASRMRYGDLTHELAFTSTSISQLLYASGFSNVQSYEDRPIPHGLKSTARRALWAAIRGMLRVYLAAETGETRANMIFSQNFLTVARR